MTDDATAQSTRAIDQCDGCGSDLRYQGVRFGSKSICENCYERAKRSIGA